MKTLCSAFLYLYSRHLNCCRGDIQKIRKHDLGDREAIRILEHFYVIAQLVGWE